MPESKACNFIEKETLAQVLSCEFCEISKNTFLHRTPLVAASEQVFQKSFVGNTCMETLQLNW